MTLRKRLVLAALLSSVAAASVAWLGAGGFTAVVIGIASGALIAVTLLRPLQVSLEDLTRVARAVARGDLSQRPSLTGEAEIGEISAALRSLTDEILARRQALGAEQAMLAGVTASTTEGLLVLDARRRVLWINEAARRLLRLDKAVPFSADLLPRTSRLWELVAASVDGLPTELTEMELNGRVLAVSARTLAQSGRGLATPASVALALIDLTRIRRLESMRRDFVANVSHELKTPLTAIRGFAETLLDDELPDDLRQQFTKTVHANAERMHRLVEELLDLARIETGGWQPQVTSVEVEALVRDIFSGLQGAAGGKGVALELAVGSETRHIPADATALRQILANLIENALRHTSVGQVEVSTTALDNGVLVRVRDTGSGIRPEHLPRIFERFYRPDPSRARDAGGTGLGLAIVKHLVEAHGGRVRAESEVGRGTVVSVFFPAPEFPELRRQARYQVQRGL